ncbi:N,N-dimethylformamidase beta subunit family domain-containing protein [Amycolatopsis lurida]
MSRRSALQGMALLTGGLVAETGGAGAATATHDPWQRFTSLVPGGDGVIYGIQADGTLLWYRHAGWAAGTGDWSNATGRPIGDGWNRFSTVLAAADGQLFGVQPDGVVRWYRYVVTNGATGEGHWQRGDGPVIGEGFHRFPRVFGGWDGVLYGVDDDGALWWYRYLAGDGSAGSQAWARGGNGAIIGSGWKPFVRLFADPRGVIFGVRQGGDLFWWRYLAGNGDPGPWAGGGNGIAINAGWSEVTNRIVFSGGSGVLYLVALDPAATPGPDSTLMWYRITNSESIDRDGRAHFANGDNGGIPVGNGFTVERSAALQGYPAAMSVQAGQELGFAVSTTFAEFTATPIRLAPEGPAAAGPARTFPGQLRLLPADFRAQGCGWPATVPLAVGAQWRSGVYALRLEAAAGPRHHVLFTVRPAVPSAPMAFLLPTNTYNAYNDWGGHNQYTVGQDGRQRTVTWRRPGFGAEAEPPARISHTLHSDLLLLRWLGAQGYSYDCYTDNDLDADSAWLPHYRVLVLGSHPEYWSERMRARLLAFLIVGGRVIYPGGNCLYERVGYTGDGAALVFRKPDGQRDTYASLGRPESEILGVALGPAYLDFHPYQVLSDHPFLAGAGLEVGDTFGHTGYNGAASGWEVEVIPAGGAARVHRIAKGRNPAGGADMVVIDHGDGWLFSASSIAFSGALADPAVSRILRNAIDSALA